MGLFHRFHAKVDRSGGSDACWPFRGAQSRGSRRETTYGSILEGRPGVKTWRANRLALCLAAIPGAQDLPEAELVRRAREIDREHRKDDAAHSCDWGPCANPGHLSWVPHRKNVQDQAHRRAMGGKIDPRVTGEMEWLARKAGAELRAERAGPGREQRWWPDPESEAA